MSRHKAQSKKGAVDAEDLRELVDCFRRVSRIHAGLNVASGQVLPLMAASATLKACWAELSGAGGMAWTYPGNGVPLDGLAPGADRSASLARQHTCTASTWMIAPQRNHSLRPVRNPPDHEALMSNMKKMLVLATAGERLERIELLAGRQKEVSFRLSTHRVGQPRMIIGEEAQRAFAREVAASLEDAVVQGLIE